VASSTWSRFHSMDAPRARARARDGMRCVAT
jgi:hypothetical protein